jgi:flagellar motor switch protein FliG
MESTATATPLTGIQKISIILSTLPDDQCVEVLKNYSEEEVERVCAAMVNPAQVDDDTRAQVLNEFSMALNEDGGQAGLETIEGVLARLYGARRSSEMLLRLKSAGGDDKGLAELAQEAGPGAIAKALAKEMPGVAAFALSEMPNPLAAKVLVLIPEDARGPVLMARARGIHLRSEIALWVREGLRLALAPPKTEGGAVSPPPEPAEILASAEILSQLTTEVSKEILEAISKQDPELGKRVAEALFTFDDLVRVEDKDLQRLLGKINQSDLKVALRKCPEAITEKVFKNMSERVGTALKEEIQISPPQKLMAVQEAQRRIASTIRDMVRGGEITLMARAAAPQAEDAAAPAVDIPPEEQLV